jgi:hypothetical protein
LIAGRLILPSIIRAIEKKIKPIRENLCLLPFFKKIRGSYNTKTVKDL